ncbi:MAG: hypothetical protein J5950_08865 [Clostridia bacterium]|nr:hypothetical protein [Clostridia bacterium]
MFEDIYGKLSAPRKEMFEPLVESDEMFVSRWRAQKYTQKSIDDNTNPYVSRRGEKFRSKSEFIIAEDLFSAKVPYIYERQIRIGAYTFHPDFTVVNVAQRREFIWEHFGMLDNPEYLESAIQKLNIYLANGFLPGIDLILTWETAKVPLNVELVRKLISELLTN